MSPRDSKMRLLADSMCIAERISAQAYNKDVIRQTRHRNRFARIWYENLLWNRPTVRLWMESWYNIQISTKWFQDFWLVKKDYSRLSFLLYIFGKDSNKLSALGENSHTLNFRHVAHVFIIRNPMLLWGLLTSLWPWWRQSEESTI